MTKEELKQKAIKASDKKCVKGCSKYYRYGFQDGYMDGYKEGFNRDDYLKKILSENMDYHNRNVFFKAVLDKYNLLGEAERLMNEALGIKEEQDGRN